MKEIFNELYELILDRKNNGQDGSYTKYLLDCGRDKILKKFGEEAVEVIIASKSEDKEHQVSEICDVLYHLWVLMVDTEIKINDIEAELLNRTKKISNLKGERKEIVKL